MPWKWLIWWIIATLFLLVESGLIYWAFLPDERTSGVVPVMVGICGTVAMLLLAVVMRIL